MRGWASKARRYARRRLPFEWATGPLSLLAPVTKRHVRREGRAQRGRRHGLSRRSLSHARSKPGYPLNGRYATAASATNTSSASITTTPATAGDASVRPRDTCCLVVQQEAPLRGGWLITAAVSDPARAHRHARAPVQAERSRACGLRVEGGAARGGALQRAAECGRSRVLRERASRSPRAGSRAAGRDRCRGGCRARAAA